MRLFSAIAVGPARGGLFNQPGGRLLNWHASNAVPASARSGSRWPPARYDASMAGTGAPRALGEVWVAAPRTHPRPSALAASRGRRSHFRPVSGRVDPCEMRPPDEGWPRPRRRRRAGSGVCRR